MIFENLINLNPIKDVYNLGQAIGSGQYAQVKKAVKQDDNQEYAIKIIDKSKMTPEDVQSLCQEIEILDQIDHPNVVKLLELFDEKNKFYMVFELMQGGELYSRFMQKNQFTEVEVVLTLKPIIDALSYCHNLNIAHRDQKPENLLYETDDPNSCLKIADFGFARCFKEELKMTTFCGSPCYVAPEILENQAYDTKVDVWSLGVIIYLQLCGYPPFMDETDEKLFELIKKAEFSFPSPDWDVISIEAQNQIKKLLVIDPNSRPTAKEILEHPWIVKHVG